MLEWLKDLLQGVTNIRIDYENGGFLSANKDRAFVRYNTGDIVWLKVVNDEWKVTGLTTHDDSVSWHESA